MTTWTSDELDRIGRAEELEISTFRRDGTHRKPVTIWAIRLGDDLYIRSAYGREAVWFRGAQAREGHIKAGGIDFDTIFADADPALSEQIDAAYRTKYRRHGVHYVDLMVTETARSATLRLLPRHPAS